MRLSVSFLAMLVLVVFANSPLMADEAITPLFGNTFSVTVVETGETQLWWFNEDGSYSQPGGAAGTWQVDAEGLMCSTPSDGGDVTCGKPEAGHAVGDTWQQQDGQGVIVEIAILAGQQS